MWQKNLVNEKSILSELAQVFQDGPNGLPFLRVSQRNHKIQMLKTIISFHIESGLTQSTWDNATPSVLTLPNSTNDDADIDTDPSLFSMTWLILFDLVSYQEYLKTASSASNRGRSSCINARTCFRDYHHHHHHYH